MWTSFKREQHPEVELQTCRCNTRGKTGSAKQPVSAAANNKRVRLFERRDQSLKGESSEGEIPWALRDEINSIGSRRSKPLKRWKTLRAERIRPGKAWVKWTPGTGCAEGKETPREAARHRAALALIDKFFERGLNSIRGSYQSIRKRYKGF